MIIMKIYAGIGNQLFQYACGRALALRNHDSLKLDTSWFRDAANLGRDKSRFPDHNGGYVDPYFLKYFNIKEGIATDSEIRKAKYPFGMISIYIERLREKLLHSKAGPTIKKAFRISDTNVEFDPRILKKTGDQYLVGYWQSEKYFKDAEDAIRREFTLKPPMAPASREALKKINSHAGSVSVHIRRGLIAQEGDSHPFWGLNDKDYIYRALACVRDRLGHMPHIFVFSDTIEAAKKDVPMEFPATYISSPDIPDQEELILMSSCKHNVIANSTFSWWAAWLNANPSKIVVAPKVWAKKDNDSFKDLIPDSWIRI